MLLLDDKSWEVKSTAGHGKGLFTKKTILPGTVIGDYLGKVIHPMDADQYEKGKHFYLMYYSDTAGIFPDLSKPDIYLINHSCTPNSWIYTYKGHTLFFALRKIFPGEELTISYLLSPQNKFCTPCTHICTCNGVFCYQTMHLSEKRFTTWQETSKRLASKTRRIKVTIDDDLPALATYPTNIGDHEFYTLFGNQHEDAEILHDTVFPSLVALRQLIRESGRCLLFPKLHILVVGIADDTIIVKNLTV